MCLVLFHSPTNPMRRAFTRKSWPGSGAKAKAKAERQGLTKEHARSSGCSAVGAYQRQSRQRSSSRGNGYAFHARRRQHGGSYLKSTQVCSHTLGNHTEPVGAGVGGPPRLGKPRRLRLVSSAATARHTASSSSIAEETLPLGCRLQRRAARRGSRPARAAPRRVASWTVSAVPRPAALGCPGQPWAGEQRPAFCCPASGGAVREDDSGTFHHSCAILRAEGGQQPAEMHLDGLHMQATT